MLRVSFFSLALMMSFPSFGAALSCNLFDDGVLIQAISETLSPEGYANAWIEHDSFFFGAAAEGSNFTVYSLGADKFNSRFVEEVSSRGTLIRFECEVN